MFYFPDLWFAYAMLFLCVLPEGSCYCRNITYETRQYTFCSDDYTKSGAENKCQEINKRLAILLTEDEFSHWKTYLFVNTLILGEVWIGATFSLALNQFVWDEVNVVVPHTFIDSSGSPDYSGISDGECLRFDRFVRLRAEPCGNANTGYFCQEIYPLIQETTTLETETTIMTTEVTSTEPSIEIETTVVPTEVTSTDPSIETTEITTEVTSTYTSIETDTTMLSIEVTSESTTLGADTTAMVIELTTAESDTTLETETTVTTTELTSTDTSLETDTLVTTDVSTDSSTTSGYMKQTDATSPTIASWTTGLTTNFTVMPGNSQLVCFCSCASPHIPNGQAELEVFKQESREKIEKELFVDTTTLSSTVRRKTSADDERPSAQSVGYLGITLMALTFFLIFALDVTRIGACGQCVSNCVKKDKLT